MQTTKKKPSLIFILVGAVLSGYLGYLINAVKAIAEVWDDQLINIHKVSMFLLKYIFPHY